MQPSTCIEAEPFALRVKDDSMAPEFREGCVIIIDPTGHAHDGAFVLAEHQGGYVFRQLCIDGDAVRLKALNIDYPLLEPDAGLAAVKGVIVQRAGRRRKHHKRYG